MTPRCEHCHQVEGVQCTTLRPSCDRMGDPVFRERYLTHLAAMQAARAVLPPEDPLPAAESDLPPIAFLPGCC